MSEIKLVIPTKEYENQVMEYKQAFLNSKDSFDGCAGLEEVIKNGRFYARICRKIKFLYWCCR